MKRNTNILLVVITILFVTNLNAQHRRYVIKNGIGLQGGITKFDIITDNFITKSNTGWIGGMAATVDLPNKWYNVSYNIQLSESNLDMEASPTIGGSEEFIEYKLMMVQVSLLGHIKIIGPNLTFDVGPMFQYNGQLELKDEDKGSYILSGPTMLMAEDISEISKINANGVIGLSAGLGGFKLRFQYIYGFTNILNKLNSNNNSGTQEKIKGNQSLMAFTVMITL